MKKKINTLLNTSWSYALIVLFTQVLGYLYMTSYIGYFNVNKTFYTINLFGDFSLLLLSTLFFLIPLVSASVIGAIVYDSVLKLDFKTFKLKMPDKNSLKIFFCYIFKLRYTV